MANDLHTIQGRAETRRKPRGGLGEVLHAVTHAVERAPRQVVHHVERAVAPPSRPIAHPQVAARRIQRAATRQTGQRRVSKARAAQSLGDQLVAQHLGAMRRQSRAAFGVRDVRRASPGQIAALRARGLLGAPVFHVEDPSLYGAAFHHNAPFARPGPYQTRLAPRQEAAFRSWVAANRIPFDVHAKTVDYDMRGFWKAGGHRAAANGHFPDTFKTPYDTTFSRESRYATPRNPFVWVGDTLVDRRTGAIVFR